jgi:phosphate transport system substrate-binding protein
MPNMKCFLRIACILAAVALVHHDAEAGETVRIGGTGSANEMVKRLAPLFLAETGIAVELIPSLGSGGGIIAAADGVIDLSISGRPLKPAETALGLKSAGELRTPFAIVTSHPNPNGLKSEDIARLNQSDKPTWADGKPIRTILRPTNESDTWLFGA